MELISQQNLFWDK